jgi:hypothetical protein
MTFVMIKSDGGANDVVATGIGGSGLGITSLTAGPGGATLHGYAVELDTYDNDTVNGQCGESINADHVNVDTLEPCLTGGGRVPSPLAAPRAFTLVDGRWHTAHVTLSNGRLSVSITNGSGSNVALFSNVALTGFTAGDIYYFGFSGATGGFSQRSEVKNINITFPTPRCL